MDIPILGRLNNYNNPDPYFHEKDPRIRIRIKFKWIRSTGILSLFHEGSMTHKLNRSNWLWD